jgi:formylglycine-generating enzyme required for sulfatase activity
MRAEGRIKVDAKFIQAAPQGWFKPGAGKTEWFKDHQHGPEMVIVPAGEFSMGSTENVYEQPVRKVVIPSPFAVGRFPVTFAEWDACIEDGGCAGHRPDDWGWGRDRRPVIFVSWDDAKLYINWLNAKTGKTYRLLSEAEREYVTRAGTTTPFWWGSSITPMQANYDGNYTYGGHSWLDQLLRPLRTKGKYRARTVPVDSFEANPWGLFNVHGNISEWCEDIADEPRRRVIRGGSWGDDPRDLRATASNSNFTDYRDDEIGFRLARTVGADGRDRSSHES